MAGWVLQQLDPVHLAVLTVVCTCCYWLGIAFNRVLWRDWGCGRLGLQCRACSGLQQSDFQNQQTMESLNLQGEEAGTKEELDRGTTLSRSFVSANRSRQLACPIAGEEDAMSDISVFSKLSQVRVIVSPPPTQQSGRSAVSVSRTPATARTRSTRKSFVSKLRGRHGKVTTSTGKLQLPAWSRGGPGPGDGATTETALSDTSQEEGAGAGRGATPGLQQARRRPARSDSDWTAPKSERRVGSPGNTAGAEYFIRQHTPLTVAIDLGCESEPAGTVAEAGPNRAVQTSPGRLPRLRSGLNVPYLPYRAGSDSEFTTDADGEDGRRPGLAVPGPVTVSPPACDLSLRPVVARELAASALAVSPASPEFEYSPVSFTQSDQELVVSPALARHTSSEAVSLAWDNYTSSPNFQRKAYS